MDRGPQGAGETFRNCRQPTRLIALLQWIRASVAVQSPSRSIDNSAITEVGLRADQRQRAGFRCQRTSSKCS